MRLRRDRRDDIDVDSMLQNLQRLQSLQHSKGLAPSKKSDFDLLTERAAARLGVPLAMVNFLESNRQMSASSQGTLSETLGIGEYSLEASYCKHVVAGDDVLYVEDSQTDELVKDNLSTTEGGIRSYLGVPIRHNGQPLASFCVFDTKPRNGASRI